VLNGLRLFYVARGELQKGCELGERCLRLAQKAGDPALVLEAHQSLGVPLFFMANLPSPESITEGFETRDLREAKALLQELR
jgi:hypothetical protein